MTTEPAGSPARRRPKGDKRARTRARILEAAAQLVSEKGYENTSVQDVARRVGLSNGAIYGNFKNRDDLFAAIGPAYWPAVRIEAKPGRSFDELMRALAEATIAVFPDRQRVGAERLTGLAYALRNAGLQARVKGLAEDRIASAAAWWRSVIDERDLPMPPEVLVRVLAAMTEGLTLQRLLLPDVYTDEVVRAAFAALAEAAPKRRAARKAPPVADP
jgi:AcrR family transcriptional regulator